MICFALSIEEIPLLDVPRIGYFWFRCANSSTINVCELEFDKLSQSTINVSLLESQLSTLSINDSAGLLFSLRSLNDEDSVFSVFAFLLFSSVC